MHTAQEVSAMRPSLVVMATAIAAAMHSVPRRRPPYAITHFGSPHREGKTVLASQQSQQPPYPHSWTEVAVLWWLCGPSIHEKNPAVRTLVAKWHASQVNHATKSEGSSGAGPTGAQ